jgi:hypothetical protein
MKSFITYPLEFEKMLFPQASNPRASGKLAAHCELFKRVTRLEGAIVKCGITADEAFTRFTRLKSIANGTGNKKMVAFEKRLVENKDVRFLSPNNNTSQSSSSIGQLHQNLLEKGMQEEVEFVSGNVTNSIPDYLIENPELKIAFLNIDLDDFESTLSALEYFYPRIVEGGILVLDNYFKYEEEYKAVNTYFCTSNITINHFLVNKGPHYIVKQ